ncbi:hypothetical protein B0H10DRAFT_1967190 [Mycena sp. CBHHK59/15]|nr:hypothetical protein B0H10DRAFT_1967190 [Mycena sp. CBHHK59/15]
MWDLKHDSINANLSIKYLHEHLTKSACGTQSAAPPPRVEGYSGCFVRRRRCPCRRQTPSGALGAPASITTRSPLHHNDTGDLRSASARRGSVSNAQSGFADAMAGHLVDTGWPHAERSSSTCRTRRTVETLGMSGRWASLAVSFALPHPLSSRLAPFPHYLAVPAFALPLPHTAMGAYVAPGLHPTTCAPRSRPPTHHPHYLCLLCRRVESLCCKSSPAGCETRVGRVAHIRDSDSPAPRIVLLSSFSVPRLSTLAHHRAFVPTARRSLLTTFPALPSISPFPSLYRSIHAMCYVV